MILNTGSRTDIPAFYSNWFYNRLEAGYVLARNPYNPSQITRYELRPELIDCIVFCTKNPRPMFERWKELEAYKTFWHVTLTPYGREIEPRLPDKKQIMLSFRELSKRVGPDCIGWRYDPIFLLGRYTPEFHLKAFKFMAERFKGYTHQVVISFIDLYEKTKRNFPQVQAVPAAQQQELTRALAAIAKDNGMKLYLCLESPSLAGDNVDTTGCLSQAVLERALGCRLNVPKGKPAREGCNCLLGADIGAYNTCPHCCIYCYANYDREGVLRNWKRHDPYSALLIGHKEEGDRVHQAEQKSWLDTEISLF